MEPRAEKEEYKAELPWTTSPLPIRMELRDVIPAPNETSEWTERKLPTRENDLIETELADTTDSVLVTDPRNSERLYTAHVDPNRLELLTDTALPN
jgi:hypothetical protein